jgi:1-phosphofructokinase
MAQGMSAEVAPNARQSHDAVAVFAPVTVLTVTLERSADGREEVHLHPGGQGVWQARMVTTLGARAMLCTPLGGESGVALDALLAAEAIPHPRIEMAESNPTWIQDRRSGDRTSLWESPPFVLRRHEIDELFSATLAAGLDCGVCVLAGTHQGVGALNPDTYRRVVGDLRASGVDVVVDLTGDELSGALEGGPSVVKVSADDMRRDGQLSDGDRPAIERMVEELHAEGAQRVVVSRGGIGAIASDGETLIEVDPPQLDVTDPRGAGDSMTAALGVGLGRGLAWKETLRLAAAAAAVNVTRHGSGTGRADAIAELTERIEIVEVFAA